MIRRTIFLVFVSLLALPLSGCSENQSRQQRTNDGSESAESKPIIAATNLALESMTKAIVGDFGEVIRPQVQPDPESGLNMDEVIRMQRAAVVFTNGPGANDAPWLNLISLNESRVHATTKDEFELSDFIQVRDFYTVHSHGDEGEHSHPWLVPHCWLNPRLAKAQSLSLLNRLIKSFPDQEALFRTNQKELIEELGEVEALAMEVAKLLGAGNLTVISSDPRLLFFTRSLKLEDNYFLWFDLPEPSVALKAIQQRKPDKGDTLLLWAGKGGSLKDHLKTSAGITMATVNLIEAVGDETDSATNYISKLSQNYQTIKMAVEGMND